ncbi:MAG: peptide ABC transporter substrate-binding protein [Betaproteobacteria bacterium SG8_41]|nr:MAG: peptide ABC transporter substrate-binding protein [Betaproteobacteria bacterium SG8_41]
MVAFLKRVIVLASVFAAGCSPAPWNNPYPARDDGTNTLYSSFTERPRHLDPVQSYAMNEFALIANIYQPPLQYHYLKRPYQLIPFAATAVPQPEFFDVQGRRLPQNARAQDIAYSDYVIRIRPGIRYQPHPALATDNQGRFVYHGLKRRDLAGIHAIGDFKERGTRELVAADYVHQIKRLAHPRLHSPIMQLMSEYIVGLKELAEQLAGENKELPRDGFLDLTKFDIAGVQVTDRYTYRVRVRGKYPQFLYWLAMPFFAPVPPEADRFYAQPGLAQKNITLDWFPIGTGPYMLTVNNPNRQMVLERNPNYEGELYPSEGEPGDAEEGLLRDAGKPLPFVDKVVYSLEKEQIPYWNKFLQGYYDTSGISSDTFDEAVQFSGQGDVTLSDEMRKRGIRLQTSVGTTVFYLGFNMLDPVVGGYSERARKLRIAISIAVDQEEFISIFRNGRGVPAHGPIPPGIFGYREGKDGINPYVYDWKDGSPRRKSIEAAQRLLAQAGYPNGRNAKTGEPLLLNLDAAGAGPDSKARFDWYVKQLDKIGVQLVVRATDWNRFQDKVRKGNTQLYYLGWGADYPDPENFLFLLHGKQSKVKTAGENASNYVNREFDSLFEQMKNMDNGPRRQAIIDRMVAVACRDAPWVWSFFPKNFSLQHAWVFNSKPNQMANNSLKYQRIDPAMREKLRREWNQPVLWPVAALFLLLALSILPAVFMFRRRERATARLDVLPEKA